MDIEKLIELLRNAAGGPEGIKMCQDAATALSTLQAENEKLKAEVEHWKDAHHQAALNFQQENRECNKALSELEQVKQERDAAIRDLEMVAVCDTCAHEHGPSCPGCNDAENWEWCGPKEG